MITAFVPAKGSSSRIPAKNLQTVGGLPLFLRACYHLRSALPADHIVVDTDSPDILKIAAEHGFRTLIRPAALATNATDGNAFFRWETSNFPESDIYIQHLPPMPFLAATTLQRALDAVQTGGYDSIVPVGRTRAYLWDPETGKPRYNLECLPNSFELPEIVFETMGLYIITAKAHRETGRRIGHHPFFLELSRMEQLDIDYPEDLELACCIDKGLPAENPCKLRAP